jgi:hypothetical protein
MKKLLGATTLLSFILLLAACSGGSSTAPDATQAYNLKINLTDMPMSGVNSVHVTVATVRVHQSASAGTDTAGWQDIPVTAGMPVDVMSLRNGVLLELCRATLPPGDYQQVRLVMTLDGVTHPIDMPSDVKITHSFTVASGQTDVTLDFVAADSMHQRSNGTYYMEPVIHASTMMK